MIPNDFIQTLLSRVDIVEVIEHYVPLKKAGANFAACCPFHNEKSPSFTVSPTKQFYHCFGCGAHGTAIGFLIEHAGMTFPEAVEQLAQQVGLSVPRTTAGAEHTGPRKDELTHLSDLLDAAAIYYKNQLRATPRAIDYLKQRGLTGEIAARFRLGFAPDGWQNLETTVPDYADRYAEYFPQVYFQPLLDAFLTQLKNTRAFPQVASWQQVGTRLGKEMDRVVARSVRAGNFQRRIAAHLR
jgi:DNA primase